MLPATRFALVLLAGSAVLGCSDPQTAPHSPLRPGSSTRDRADRVGFGFNGTVSGFPTGQVTLTGGGSNDPSTASNTIPTETTVNSAGGFSCDESVGQGPLSGCAAGEGVRWDTAQLLVSTGFKCTGAASEAAKTATTGSGKVVLRADFYRAGDGIDESFTAKMIVSETDLDPARPGVQNIWIEGVGCGTGIVHFN